MHAPPLQGVPQLVSLQLLPQMLLGAQQAPVVQEPPQLSMQPLIGWHPPPSGTHVPPPESATQKSPLHAFPQLSWQLTGQGPVGTQAHAPVVQLPPQLSMQPLSGWQSPPSGTHAGPESGMQAPPLHGVPQLVSLQLLPQTLLGVQQAPVVQLPPQLSMQPRLGLHPPPSGTQGPESTTQAPVLHGFPQPSRQLLPQVPTTQHPGPVVQAFPQPSTQKV
jgi:hypothetical protein